VKEQLFQQKERDWLKFGYSKEYLDSMRAQSFWDAQYARVGEYNSKILTAREVSAKEQEACSTSR